MNPPTYKSRYALFMISNEDCIVVERKQFILYHATVTAEKDEICSLTRKYWSENVGKVLQFAINRS